MSKSRDAFRNISEVAEALDTPAHVLRFWESKFTQVKPVKRAGGRRYYRPGDVDLLAGIKQLLHDDGMTIKGVQKILREQGVKHVSAIGGADTVDADAIETIAEAPFVEAIAEDTLVPFPVKPDNAPASVEPPTSTSQDDSTETASEPEEAVPAQAADSDNNTADETSDAPKPVLPDPEPEFDAPFVGAQTEVEASTDDGMTSAPVEAIDAETEAEHLDSQEGVTAGQDTDDVPEPKDQDSPASTHPPVDPADPEPKAVEAVSVDPQEENVEEPRSPIIESLWTVTASDSVQETTVPSQPDSLDTSDSEDHAHSGREDDSTEEEALYSESPEPEVPATETNDSVSQDENSEPSGFEVHEPPDAEAQPVLAEESDPTSLEEELPPINDAVMPEDDQVPTNDADTMAESEETSESVDAMSQPGSESADADKPSESENDEDSVPPALSDPEPQEPTTDEEDMSDSADSAPVSDPDIDRPVEPEPAAIQIEPRPAVLSTMSQINRLDPAQIDAIRSIQTELGALALRMASEAPQ